LSEFNEILIFSTDIRKIYIKFHEIPPVIAELLHVDGHTDRRDEANSCFS